MTGSEIVPASAGEPERFSPYDPGSWPASHGVYMVTVSIPIVAHNETQATKRAQDMMDFLEAWAANESGPHRVSRYLYDSPEVGLATHSHDDTYASRQDIGAGMVSDREFIYDWVDPHSDDDYDPIALAEKIYFCRDEDE